MEKLVRCPNCHTINSVDGNPGEIKTITCSSCHIPGKVTFQKSITKSGNHAIEVINLRKEYGDLVAVNSISFSVKQGEIFAFLGPNGAGKTTTVEMIESIRKPTSGTICLFGKDIINLFQEVKEQIGILPQEFHSFERINVKETLQYYASLYQKQADIDQIMDIMDLRIHETKLYKNLSGGLKQRVGVAIALVNDPDIVFLDEPTTGLDPKARREVWNVIVNLRNRGKTIFLTTHYMEEAEFLADHIAIIHKGNIIAEGTLEQLLKKFGKDSILNIDNCYHPDIIELLKKQGFEAYKKENGTISIIIKNKDKIFEVLSWFRHECIEYAGIDIRRPNLEEIFLKLTGAKLTEEYT
jgi:ABC-2 type transport system ATP-binding protein